MKINVFFEEIEKFEKPENLKQKLEQLIEGEHRIPGDINIIFCHDDYLLKLNKDYLNHDYYTDVITFDFSGQNIISGDIFISTDRVRENAQLYTTDFTTELQRVIIHGTLHLIGFNDKEEEEKKTMTMKEDFYLNSIFSK